MRTASKGYLSPSKVMDFYSKANWERETDPVKRNKMLQEYGMGASVALMDAEATVPTSPFLSFIVPQYIQGQVAPNKAKMVAGVNFIGCPQDREVIYTSVVSKGTTDVFTDFGSNPLSNFSIGFTPRDVVLIKGGVEVKWLEDLQYQAANFNVLQQKTIATNIALDQAMDAIGFNGYAGKRTYGILNDPSLLAYETAPKAFSAMTFAEMQATINLMASKIRSQSYNLVEPTTDTMVFLIPISVRATLDITNTLSVSILEWMRKTYPNMRIETTWRFEGANGGANVAYMFAEKVENDVGSTDNKAVMSIGMQAEAMVIGAGKILSSYQMESVSATSGAFVGRPFAVTRWTGV